MRASPVQQENNKKQSACLEIAAFYDTIVYIYKLITETRNSHVTSTL
jgi:hypothetical protein